MHNRNYSVNNSSRGVKIYSPRTNAYQNLFEHTTATLARYRCSTHQPSYHSEFAHLDDKFVRTVRSCRGNDHSLTTHATGIFVTIWKANEPVLAPRFRPTVSYLPIGLRCLLVISYKLYTMVHETGLGFATTL